MAKGNKDAVAIVYVGQKDKEGEAAPASVKFYHNERPTSLELGKSTKAFNRAEALAILDNARTWKINAKLVIKELAVEEDEAEGEADEAQTGESADGGDAPKRRGRKPKNG